MDIIEDEKDPFDAIVDAPFDAALSERYLVYALSTITARSLPDLRDGLKPVHRRILWGMRGLRLDPGSAFKKCSRIVGDVMGKYHPHGNLALYDALVRLAQPFTLRYPLVEGQGNFGNIDGDNAAAERYTECRLTKTAMQLMEGLDEGTVDFVPTYNNEEEEPSLFRRVRGKRPMRRRTKSTTPLDIPQMPFDDALRIALNSPPLRKEKKKRRKKARSKGTGLARG